MRRLRLKDRGTRGPAVLPLQMHHPVPAAPAEPASRWPLKGSRARGGGGGCSSQPSRGCQGGRKGLNGALSRPPAHRPPPHPPVPLGAELGWSVASWPGGEHPALVLTGPPRPARGCQQGLRAPTQACGFPVSPPAPGPTRCRGAHTQEPSEPGRGSGGSRRRLPNIWKHRLPGRAVPEVAACCFG